jgi:hypothetical protein
MQRIQTFFSLCVILSLWAAVPTLVWAQADGEDNEGGKTSNSYDTIDTNEPPLPLDSYDPMDTYIGKTVNDLFTTFGAPLKVYAVRGSEVWQDDVVFVYDVGDFYLYRNQVWQIGVPAAHAIVMGDNRETVRLLMGETRFDFDRYIAYSISGHSWPLMIRFNIDDTDHVSAIFIYRPDF